MKKELESYMKAGYPALYLVTPEETRVEVILKDIGDARNWPVYHWTCSGGLVCLANGSQVEVDDPDALLGHIRNNLKPEGDQHIIINVVDFHLFLMEPNPFLVRALKDTIRYCKHEGIHLVFTGARRMSHPEIDREITTIEFELPTRKELSDILDASAKSFGVKVNGDRDPILSSVSGLTSIETENALALSFVRSKCFDPADLAKEKANQVKQSGLLEIVEGKVGLDQIGGLELLKRWMAQRRNGFSQKARDRGLPYPKGCLILGLPGTGKSLTAKATMSIFGIGGLRLDMGRIFGSLVGESEANIRLAIKTAEAMSPCVLWIDEIDKGIGGSSGGTQDGGTSDRVLGTLLNWMQEKTSPVFVIATANDPARLAASDGALVRKGRFDELFFVDLPTAKEREAIWKIKLKQFNIDPEKVDLTTLIEESDTFTGAEIESVAEAASWMAFDDDERHVSEIDLMAAISDTTPLASTMKENIERTRRWAATRCRPASESAPIINERNAFQRKVVV